MAHDPTTRSRRGRPARINRELIVDAAVSAGNLDTLTMRELAARLGVTHTALYRWVKNRDQLFDLINEAMVERVLPAEGPRDRDWRPWLARTAWAMHDQFLVLPGYATRLSRPHRHTTQAFERLRNAVITAFTDAGVSPHLAEQSWYIFITSTVSWLAVHEHPLDLGDSTPRFELFLDTLLRGLPAREPGAGR
ncbi:MULTISPECIES: TetR/AcrR family transcriptional regulator [Streptomyces]|uniref:AcrR family transcriptional regulator n=1 Tax=Streptomyces demainii TaxID=588122 RepID=A0ABT9KVS4_9ACTN|nr:MULTISPECIES: TetR/AcrR family transcriptional regulator [Streptomyces]MDP9612522.1 AcrR family transcriptional regulator [Streptomyces demainii]